MSSTSRSSRGGSRASLSTARKRFARWRRSRPVGTRIPEDLWDLAVELAADHGVSRTATALRLDYYGLKRRVEDPAVSTVANEPEHVGFVEVPMLPVDGVSCALELQDARGVQLRVALTGASSEEVGAVARALWEASR